MKNEVILPPKSIKELFVHAVLFELIAMLICAPLFAWIMGTSVLHMGILTFIIACIAMLWNMVFNALFERIEQSFHWQRTQKIRMVHAGAFEFTLIVLTIPVTAWWLGIEFMNAFLMEIGIILFFLPYTYLYNLIYDMLRRQSLFYRRG